jgi:hypothetical protein
LSCVYLEVADARRRRARCILDRSREAETSVAAAYDNGSSEAVLTLKIRQAPEVHK